MSSFGILRRVEWQFDTDDPRQLVDLRGTNQNLKDKTDRLSRDVSTNLPFYGE